MSDRPSIDENKRAGNTFSAADKNKGRSGSAVDLASILSTDLNDAFAEGRRNFLEHGFGGCRDILDCFDRAVAIRRLGDVALDADPIDIYFSDRSFARISPNLLFDEQWYLDTYEDVRYAVANGSIYSGFVHFVINGVHEGRCPNPTLDVEFVQMDEPSEPSQVDFDVEAYVQTYRIVQRFLECFPLLDAVTFYNLYGRRLGHTIWGDHDEHRKISHDLISHEFDHDYYSSQYLGKKVSRSTALRHYKTLGIREGHNPNPKFDELWYRTFYTDINQAVTAGKIESGFHHYLTSGRQEGRRQAHDLKYALEARLAGVTEPRLVQRAEEIAQRMQSLPHRIVAQGEPRIWFCLPMLNPDMSFGGYKAVFELIKATARAGRAIGIFITEDATDELSYFAYRERDRELVSVIQAAAYVNRVRGKYIPISPNDIFVVYSVWDAYIVQPLLKVTRAKRFLLLAQEFEPIFYECGATRALTQDAYQFPHVPLYNSRFLQTYFAKHAVGPFGERNAPREGSDYFVFEHVPTRLSVEAREADTGTRTLAFYARPEMHAARNLFELGYLALRKLCNEGVFDHRWRFVGLGGLQEDHVLPLGEKHQIDMVQKMPLDEYARFMNSIDIGLSLMWAPHPSVVPFEFAATGAVVVTNTYENRSAEELEAICRNIVPCPPTLAGIEAALRRAVARAEDRETRQRQRLIGPDRTWKETFAGDVLDPIFASLQA
ncbi:hypothetical protein [Methylobacterium sp. J-068]|uniref:rhamnosyltransferase WsaF family glycosyltransferase n=1 Tax=Methylobacterium sp. J-068 TaxID=2836649 RepID=UPI001FBAF4A7|nr:hypothetical protein [Methylobacterium sp. J-068]MCJ2035237.1 hypothetical protein [Methylobacterium sp. J-068]